MYSARKPFHPKRLFDLIHDKFIVLQNVDQVGVEVEHEEDEEDEDMGSLDDNSEEEGEMADSDTEMNDELDTKTFQKEIDPKVGPSLDQLNISSLTRSR